MSVVHSTRKYYIMQLKHELVGFSSFLMLYDEIEKYLSKYNKLDLSLFHCYFPLYIHRTISHNIHAQTNIIYL